MNTQPVKLGVFGASGRMGQRVVACANDQPGITVTQCLDRDQQGDFSTCDVVIDFSVAAATDALMARLGESTALVTGVTGRNHEQEKRIATYAQGAPVFVAANFSLGVALLDDLSRRAARVLGSDFDIEIFETHHRRKADAPSGTALHLARAVADASNLDWPQSQRNRDGLTGPRGDREIGVAALRGGDVIGDHTVFFFGPSERVELTHRAENRDVFAHGALRSARWLNKQSVGLYSMAQMLSEIA